MWLSMGIASTVRRRQNCAQHCLVSQAVLAVHANRASSCFFKELFFFFFLLISYFLPLLPKHFTFGGNKDIASEGGR